MGLSRVICVRSTLLGSDDYHRCGLALTNQHTAVFFVLPCAVIVTAHVWLQVHSQSRQPPVIRRSGSLDCSRRRQIHLVFTSRPVAICISAHCQCLRLQRPHSGAGFSHAPDGCVGRPDIDMYSHPMCALIAAQLASCTTSSAENMAPFSWPPTQAPTTPAPRRGSSSTRT